jgi:hypothetical protein
MAKRSTAGNREPKAVEKKHGIELRFDQLGEFDELTTGPATCVRVERMGTGHWWLRIYTRTGSVDLNLHSTTRVHPIAEWD